jgi:hypothetical protein
MMFILRSPGKAPPTRQIKATRKTPDIVPNGAGKTDYFCIGDAAEIAALREAGAVIVELRDGWYADDRGGGIAISGHGKYWEIRDTPFTVREASGPAEAAGADAAGEMVNVRRAVFGV